MPVQEAPKPDRELSAEFQRSGQWSDRPNDCSIPRQCPAGFRSKRKEALQWLQPAEQVARRKIPGLKYLDQDHRCRANARYWMTALAETPLDHWSWAHKERGAVQKWQQRPREGWSENRSYLSKSALALECCARNQWILDWKSHSFGHPASWVNNSNKEVSHQVAETDS